MARLEKLTPTQESWIPEIRQEWIDLALNPEPIDRDRVRPHVDWLYSLVDERPPVMLVVDSPFIAQICAHIAQQEGLRGQLWDQLRGQLWGQLWGQLGDQLWGQLWDQLWDQLRGQLGDQLWGQLWDQLRGQLWGQLWDQLGGQKIIYNYQDFGIVSCGYWVAWLEMGVRLGLISDDRLTRYGEFLRCGVYDGIFLKGLAILINRPLEIHFERQDTHPVGQWRLHRLDGPAVVWRDGHRQYYISGVPIQNAEIHYGDFATSPAILDDVRRITRDMILEERNAEVRKGMIQAVGLPRFLEMTEAKILDQDTDASGMPRRLLSIEAGRDQRWCVVEVECPSKRDKHYLWVPPNMERCSQAIAWTFGFEVEDDYRPMVEA